MNLPAVLVIGSPKKTELTEALFESGLTPVFRETILSAIATLRKEPFPVIVIDHKATTVDPLEIILNIRDVNESVRVFVLAEDDEETDPSPYRELVPVVHLKELVRKLTPTTLLMTAAAGSNTPTTRLDEDAKK